MNFFFFIQALEFLHNTGRVIHRDLKAGNLLLSNDGEIKLGLFVKSCHWDEKLGADCRNSDLDPVHTETFPCVFVFLLFSREWRTTS